MQKPNNQRPQPDLVATMQKLVDKFDKHVEEDVEGLLTQLLEMADHLAGIQPGVVDNEELGKFVKRIRKDTVKFRQQLEAAKEEAGQAV